jgi:hypothetical protein
LVSLLPLSWSILEEEEEDTFLFLAFFFAPFLVAYQLVQTVSVSQSQQEDFNKNSTYLLRVIPLLYIFIAGVNLLYIFIAGVNIATAFLIDD